MRMRRMMRLKTRWTEMRKKMGTTSGTGMLTTAMRWALKMGSRTCSTSQTSTVCLKVSTQVQKQICPQSLCDALDHTQKYLCYTHFHPKIAVLQIENRVRLLILVMLFSEIEVQLVLFTIFPFTDLGSADQIHTHTKLIIYNPIIITPRVKHHVVT